MKNDIYKLNKFQWNKIKDLIEANKLFSELVIKNSFNSIILLLKLKPEIDIRFDNDSLFNKCLLLKKLYIN